MENLHLSMSNLRHDRDVITAILLDPLDKELSEILQNNGAIPLCQQTRRCRMDKLLNIVNQVVLSMDNFTDDQQMLEHVPVELLSEVTQEILQATSRLHQYCQNDLILYQSKVLGINVNEEMSGVNEERSGVNEERSGVNEERSRNNPGSYQSKQRIIKKGKEEEILIHKIHQLLQKVLETLKLTGIKLQENVPILNQENSCYGDDDDDEDPVNPVVFKETRRNSVKETIPSLSVKRQDSFEGTPAVKLVGNNGHFNVSNIMFVDHLMMQMPLEYVISEGSE